MKVVVLSNFLKFVFEGSQSQLSLASEEELVEVINFLSGAPLRRRTPMADEKDTQTVTGSHVMSTDSGMGSCLSVASSYFTPTGSVSGHGREGERKTSSDSQGSCGDEVVAHPKVTNKRHKGKSPVTSPSRDKFRKKEIASTEISKDKGETKISSALDTKVIDNKKVSESMKSTNQTANTSSSTNPTPNSNSPTNQTASSSSPLNQTASGSSPVNQDAPGLDIQPPREEKEHEGIFHFFLR